MFELHSQLAADTVDVGDLNLCKVLLMNQAQVPWLILVPRRNRVSEIYMLNEADQKQFWLETCLVSRMAMQLFEGDKLNTAALGNIVSQLHMHIVVRYKDDPAWPHPVWGVLEPHPYTTEELKLVRENLHTAIQRALETQRRH